MADNVAVTAGSGTTIAADEVIDATLGTVKVQYVKLMDGTLDGSTKAAVGAGGLKVDPTSAVAMNTGVRSATTQRVTIATDDSVPVTIASVPSHAVTNAGTFAVQVSNANANGRAVPASSAPVVLNSMTYSAKAASSTAALFGATGASGDYLDGVLIIPATAAAGVVSITDGSGSAITIFAGGVTTALPTLAPFYVPIGAISSGGAGGWKVTTGTFVSVIGIGNFT